MSDSQWIGQVKDQRLLVVAQALGMGQRRGLTFAPCPACQATERGKEDKRGPVGAAADRRGWRCHRCQGHGDALDLIAHVRLGKASSGLNGAEWTELRQFCSSQGWCGPPGGRSEVRSVGSRVSELLGEGLRIDPSRDASRRSGNDEPRAQPPDEAPQSGPFAWRPGLAEECATRIWAPEAAPVLDYLTSARKFDASVIREWSLGAAYLIGGWWLTIPLRDSSERVVNVRFRRVPDAEGNTPKPKYRVCSGRPLPLFGAHTLGTDLGNVIVVEGELDVIALWQYGLNKSVVSGTAGAATFTDEWLDLLEPYASFTIAYDDDDAGNQGAEKIAAKLGLDRCSRAILPRNDAGKCLEDGIPAASVTRTLDMAQPMFGVEFKRVGAYKSQLEQLIRNPDTLRGRSTGSAKLDHRLGGLRPGLMIVTGETGHGKSSFGCWLCYQQAKLFGTPVAVTAFENRAMGAVQKLLRMQIGGDFTRVSEEDRVDALLELDRMPIHVLDHYGHIPPDKLMNTIRYSARRLGVKVLLLDHLGFIVPPEADDERRAIEAIIRALAITAYTLEITIILACHPKSVPSNAPRVTMNDLKGASAIKQDASEVIVVVRDPPRPKAKPPRHWPASIIYIDKVRSEFGLSGSSVTLAYGPFSCIYGDSWEHTPEGSGGQLVISP